MSRRLWWMIMTADFCFRQWSCLLNVFQIMTPTSYLCTRLSIPSFYSFLLVSYDNRKPILCYSLPYPLILRSSKPLNFLLMGFLNTEPREYGLVMIISQLYSVYRMIMYYPGSKLEKGALSASMNWRACSWISAVITWPWLCGPLPQSRAPTNRLRKIYRHFIYH